MLNGCVGVKAFEPGLLVGSGHVTSTTLTIMGKVTIDFFPDPISVTLADGVTVDEGAKVFLNTVCQLVGRPPMFPATTEA
jgi:hypothetical protein